MNNPINTRRSTTLLFTAAAILAVIVVVLMLATPGHSVIAQNNGDPDSTRDVATSRGDITNQSRAKSGNHCIDGADDTVDRFTFSLTHTREVMVQLKDMETNANLYVEDQDGDALANSTESGAANETIIQELDVGSYTIQVTALGEAP